MPSRSHQRARKVVTRGVHNADIIIDRTLRSAEKRGLPPQVRYTMNAFDKKAKKVLKNAEKRLQQNMQSSQQSPYQHLASQYPPPSTPPPPPMNSIPPPPPGYPTGNGGSSSSKPHRKQNHLTSSGYPQGTKVSSKHSSKYSSKHQKPPKGYPKPPKGYPKYKKHGQGHGYPPPPPPPQQHGNGKPSLQGKITSKLSDPAFQAQAIKFVKKKVAKEFINGFS